MSDYDEVGIRAVSELFERCKQLHRESYPGTSVDVDKLNLTGQLTHGTWAHAKGHFADIYKGEMKHGVLVAVKMLRLPAYHPTNERVYQTTFLRFFRELHHWAQLDHINVVRMLGFTSEGGNISLISRWYPRGDLAQYILANPDASKQDLMLDVAEGILYLHTCTFSLVHGDLKAANILICERGIARLTDFGISKQLHDMNRKTGFTTTSGVMGTGPWMAPELDGGPPLTFQSDIYSFGGVLLEICCPGRYPYHYVTHPRDMILAKDRGELPQRLYYPEMSGQDSLWWLMSTCWEHDPQRRPDIRSIVRALYRQFRLGPRRASLGAPIAIRERLPAFESAVVDMIESDERHMRDMEFLDEEGSERTIAQCQLLRELKKGGFQRVRDVNKKLLDTIHSSQEARWPIFTNASIGAAFLANANEIREAYTAYAERLPFAEREFKGRFGIEIAQVTLRPGGKHLQAGSQEFKIMRLVELPMRQLKGYPWLLQQVCGCGAETGGGDTNSLRSAIEVFSEIWTVVQAKAFPSVFDSQAIADCVWYHTVSEKVLQETSVGEAKRQSLIFEFIQAGLKFVYDSSLKSKATSKHSKESEDVLESLADLHCHHGKILDLLVRIQWKEHPFISCIAEPLSDALPDLVNAYFKYLGYRLVVVHSRDLDPHRRGQSSHFSKVLDELDSLARSFLVASRHTLMAIQECTPPGHHDHQFYPKLFSSFGSVIETAESCALLFQCIADLSSHPERLEFGSWDPFDVMDLSKTEWTLFHVGSLFLRCIEDYNMLAEVRVLLFGNYLVITGQVERSDGIYYVVNRRPIPAEFLQVQDLDPSSQVRSPAFRIRHANKLESHLCPYSFSVAHMTRVECNYTFFCRSAYERDTWKSKIQRITAARKYATKVFSVLPVDYHPFQLGPASPMRNLFSQSRRIKRLGKVRVTCSANVSLRQPGGRGEAEWLIAFGCAAGVWMGYYYSPSVGIETTDWEEIWQKLFPVKAVTQCAIVENCGILLILADGVLWAYHIRRLLSLSSSKAKRERLTGQGKVISFKIGTTGNRKYLVYWESIGASRLSKVWDLPSPSSVQEQLSGTTTFKILEVLPPKGREKGKWLDVFKSQRTPEWCNLVKEVSLPEEYLDVVFLEEKLAFLSPSKGFEVMVVDQDPIPRTPPEYTSTTTDWLSTQANARPLGLFSCRDRSCYMLCYEDFGVYIGHRDESSVVPFQDVIQWESRAERITLYPPYLLIFHKQFIEIRHIDTGRLLQTILATEIYPLSDDVWQEGTRVYFAQGGGPATEGAIPEVFELRAEVT